MARPRKHDGSLSRREESKVWWMVYRDRAGQRQRESTNTENWDEAQRRLRERLQARDGNTLPLLRKGEQIAFSQWSEYFLGAFSKPPIRAAKTHLVPEPFSQGSVLLWRSSAAFVYDLPLSESCWQLHGCACHLDALAHVRLEALHPVRESTSPR